MRPKVKELAATAMLLLLAQTAAPTHERLTDPVLSELNDYLMAIQILRYQDDRAGDIFALWQSVRDASWAIRDLTDSRGLSIHDSTVQKQIAAAREARRRLRERCRAYFASLETTLPRTPRPTRRLKASITAGGKPLGYVGNGWRR